MRPSQTILVLEDLRGYPVGPLYRKGLELDSRDSQTVLDVYQQWLLLLVDLGYLSHETLKRDTQRLWSDMIKADVLYLNNAFAELLHLVRCKTNKGFKALCKQISPHLFNHLKGDYGLMLRGDVFAAKRLCQAFAFTSRLSLRYIDLTQQCLDDYMEVEDTMPSHYPGYVVHFLNEIIKRWMKSFDPSRLHCQHGPGGVAGHGRVPYQVKYKDLTSDGLLEYAFGSPRWVQSQTPSSMDRISHTIFVPKSYKTFRTISMESSTTMYFQQSVWKEIDRVVSSSYFLRNRIGFHEQERNQRLAKEGSVTRKYATIDLSAASDSVSYELVKRVFRGTKLLRYIIATRSHSTLLPDGRLIRIKKFAPMGSALCFPIETIIFAAICHFVTREHGVTGDYSVFGDDIIVPTQCAEDVMGLLSELGFRANREKSFYQSDIWFRESCGAEYCDGYDVTPLRISRDFFHAKRDTRIEAYMALANECYTRGFRNLRQFYLKKIFESRRTPLFAPTSILSDNYTNYHTKTRWNIDLQRLDCRVSTLTVKFDELDDEDTRYRHWLESTHDRTSIGDGFQSSVTSTSVKFRDRWQAKPYEVQDQDLIQSCLAAQGIYLQ